jgi:hypothetical protein
VKNLLLILFLSLIFSQWSLGAEAQSPSQMTVNQKIQRLEATVEELTLRLAEKIQENQRMEIVLKEALKASRSGRPVVSGCDVAAFKRESAYNDYAYSRTLSWLQDRAKDCHKRQLEDLRNLVTGNVVSPSHHLRVIDFEIGLR